MQIILNKKKLPITYKSNLLNLLAKKEWFFFVFLNNRTKTVINKTSGLTNI